jgi:hypothetical protein
MSLLKRIGGTGPMPNGSDGVPGGTGALSKPGTPGGTAPGAASPTNVIPRAGTGRLASPGEAVASKPNSAMSGDNFLDLKNRVQHR